MDVTVKEVLESREKKLIGQVRRGLMDGSEAVTHYLGYINALVDIGQIEKGTEANKRIGNFVERVYKLN